MRVVSLLPSATEIVCALGHGAELVGRSSECDYPAAVTELPAVMRPKTLDASAPSREIDARVQTTRGRGESLYWLDLPALRALRPDLLLTQDLCSVCSVTEAEVAAACSAAGIAPETLSLSPRTLDDVVRSIEQVAQALGDAEAGRRVAGELRARIRSPDRSTGKRVAVVEWIDPPILAGLWATEMVHAAGGTSIGPCVGAPGLRTDWNAIRSAAPDLVVVTPCSFSVTRTLRELADPALAEAVRGSASEGRILLADEAYFSRPGPRLADGVELLRALLLGRSPPAPMPVARWPSAGEVAP